LKGFTALLLDHLRGRVLLVRKAPPMPGTNGEGIIVVVTGAPAEVRPLIENCLSEHYITNAPQLHLMDVEGFRALSAFLPALDATLQPNDIAYHHIASLPVAASNNVALQAARRKRASEGLAFAEKRLALADVLLKGGFPEEMTRPLREALGWALTSLLALQTDRDPAADLPSPRLVQAELVEPGRLPGELGQRLAQVRDLTAPPEAEEETVPLSAQTGQSLLTSVRELVTLVQQQGIKVGA
jgi:hypothetical protein